MASASPLRSCAPLRRSHRGQRRQRRQLHGRARVRRSRRRRHSRSNSSTVRRTRCLRVRTRRHRRRAMSAHQRLRVVVIPDCRRHTQRIYAVERSNAALSVTILFNVTLWTRRSRRPRRVVGLGSLGQLLVVASQPAESDGGNDAARPLENCSIRRLDFDRQDTRRRVDALLNALADVRLRRRSLVGVQRHAAQNRRQDEYRDGEDADAFDSRRPCVALRNQRSGR